MLRNTASRDDANFVLCLGTGALPLFKNPAAHSTEAAGFFVFLRCGWLGEMCLMAGVYEWCVMGAGRRAVDARRMGFFL